MSTLIHRDAFAREELHSMRIYCLCGETCQECGQDRVTASGRRFLYVYRIEPDSGRAFMLRGSFCSVACMRAYNGIAS